MNKKKTTIVTIFAGALVGLGIDYFCGSHLLKKAGQFLDGATVKENPACPVVSSTTLENLILEFEAYVKAHKSYAPLLECPSFEPLFSLYPHLRNPVFDVEKIKVDEVNPQKIDGYFKYVRAVLTVAYLPTPYRKLVSEVGFFLHQDRERMIEACPLVDGEGCYDPQAKMIHLYPPRKGNTLAHAQAFIHQLAHVAFYQLPDVKRKQVELMLENLLKQAQSDLVRNVQGMGVSWKDGTDDPRYCFVSPRGASNVQEHLATYAEEMFIIDWSKMQYLLRSDYSPQVFETMAVMTEAGLHFSPEEWKKLVQESK